MTAPGKGNPEKRLPERQRRADAAQRRAGKRKKIALFSTLDSFLGDITEHFERRYEVRKCSGSRAGDIAALMRWSDLSWFEWCDNLLIYASRLEKTAPVICRMHRYEAFTTMPERVNWQNVDHLICVIDLIADVVRKRIPGTTPVSVIPNGVNFDRYPPPENKTYGKKVAYAGYIKKPKGAALLLQCFAKMHAYDPEYTFHVAGVHQDMEIELYFNHVVEKLGLPVIYYGWVDPIAPWFADKDYIISSSISESFQYAVAEGIASGLLPLVHTWPGSEDIYPEDCLFVTVDDCLNLLRTYEESDKKALAQKYRNHLRRRFSLERQLEAIDAVVGKYL